MFWRRTLLGDGVGKDGSGRRYEALLTLLEATGGAVVAFSGGVDSTLLLYAARRALGDSLLAVTIDAPYIPKWEIREARKYADLLGVKRMVLEVPFPEELRLNPPDHCYTCKKYLFERLWDAARCQGFSHVLDGTNADDPADYRPGLKALRELGVESPLLEAGLGKRDIRTLSGRFDLPTRDKPAYACLLSRLPIGERVDEKDLERIELSEVFLMKKGFPAVRVRRHGDAARIEVPSDKIALFVDETLRLEIDKKFKVLGWRHAAVDLAGYTMGSLNRPKG